jgi:hypothetical protein
MDECVKHSLHARTNALRRRAPPGTMGCLLCACEIEEVCALGLVELERAGDCLKHLLGHPGRVAALKARVVVGAYSSKERRLLAAKARNAPRATAVDRQSGLLRTDPRAPRCQELADLLLRVHAGTVALRNTR